MYKFVYFSFTHAWLLSYVSNLDLVRTSLSVMIIKGENFSRILKHAQVSRWSLPCVEGARYIIWLFLSQECLCDGQLSFSAVYQCLDTVEPASFTQCIQYELLDPTYLQLKEIELKLWLPLKLLAAQAPAFLVFGAVRRSGRYMYASFNLWRRDSTWACHQRHHFVCDWFFFWCFHLVYLYCFCDFRSRQRKLNLFNELGIPGPKPNLVFGNLHSIAGKVIGLIYTARELRNRFQLYTW